MLLKNLLNRSRKANGTVTRAGEVQLFLEDYAELERDFGHQRAGEIQQLLAERLRGELSRYDTLKVDPRGRFSLEVRDAEGVDLTRIAHRLVELIEGEPVWHRRSLVECRARATVIAADVPTLTESAELVD